MSFVVVVAQQVDIHHHRTSGAQGGAVAQTLLHILELGDESVLIKWGGKTGEHIDILWCVLGHAISGSNDGMGKLYIGESATQGALGTEYLTFVLCVGSYGYQYVRIHW